jgi:pectin lyase
MHLTTITTIALTMLVCGSSGQALRRVQRAVGVSGSAQGFGRGTTGGSGGRTVTPNNNAELVNYLTSKETLTIVLTKTFDFTGTEGRTTATGCAPWGTGAGCQLAINANNWCSSTAQKVQVNYDNAGTNPINMGSNKSVVGSGKNGVIKGKGLRMANGVQNVILQNFMITGLNPQYVWGGDAITLDGSDKIWIDHVTVSNRCPSISGS